MLKALALLLSAAMLLCLHPAAAQQPNTLTGTVTDSASGKAVGYATVSLQRDSVTVVNAVAANSDGRFSLNAPETVGNYLEKVRSSLGAKYAFNKSHAAAYAFVSYQTAWLKYYFPVEFMAALKTSCIDTPGKVAEYI